MVEIYIDRPDTIEGTKAREKVEMSIIKWQLLKSITIKLLIVGIYIKNMSITSRCR